MNATEEVLFFDACRRGDLESVQQMQRENPGLAHSSDLKGYTPLIIAVYNDQPEVVDFLLQQRAGLSGQDGAGNTALMGACFRGYAAIVRKLLEAGADVNQRNYQGATALTFAATFGHLQIAELLLNRGALVNLRDVRGKSALDHAIIQENEAMVALLLPYAQSEPV